MLYLNRYPTSKAPEEDIFLEVVQRSVVLLQTNSGDENTDIIMIHKNDIERLGKKLIEIAENLKDSRKTLFPKE